MEFEQFCDTVERMSTADRDRLMAADAKLAMRGIMVLAGGDFNKAVSMLTGAAVAAASVDGKLDQEEYRHINGLISAAVGKENSVTYAQVKASIEENVDMSTNDRGYVRSLFADLARIDQESATALIEFLIGFMCVDGEATWSERKWLTSLYQRFPDHPCPASSRARQTSSIFESGGDGEFGGLWERWGTWCTGRPWPVWPGR